MFLRENQLDEISTLDPGVKDNRTGIKYRLGCFGKPEAFEIRAFVK